MPIVYRILADLVVAAHFTYVMFVIDGLVVIFIGGIVGWEPARNLWFRLIHLLMIGIVVTEAWCGATCPLTIWENKLRRLGGETTYAGGFIANALHDALFFEAEPWVFTLCYSLIGLAVLATLFLVPPHRRNSTRKSIVRSTKMEQVSLSESPDHAHPGASRRQIEASGTSTTSPWAAMSSRCAVSDRRQLRTLSYELTARPPALPNDFPKDSP
jgi:hypothetical protein